MHVCMSLLAFLPITQKSSGNPYLKICDLIQYLFCGCPYENLKKKISVRGGTGLFGHQVQNIYFFALIKKIFLPTLVEIILDIIIIFLEFWDPLGPPTNKMKKIKNPHMEY